MSNSTDKMEKVFDCFFTRPYAEDDYPLNDYIENLIHHLSWKMFKHQDEICFNISEKNPPMLKDNVIEYMQNVLDVEFGSVRNYIICRMLISYRMSNVDLGFEGEWYLREDLGEDLWKEFNDVMNRYVWDDYCESLGPEKAKKYFKKINRPEFIMEDD